MRKSPRPKLSGIYIIRNSVNGKVYIGSSKDIYTRWSQHKHDLKRNIHHNAILQRAWNKYGEDSFVFEIQELVEPAYLLDREQYWYDYHRSSSGEHGYNLSPIARSSSSYATVEDLKNGKLSFNETQFYEAIFYLRETDLSIPKIASKTGIAVRTLYQIYFKTEYSHLTEGYTFKQRVNTSARKLNEDQVLAIINKLLAGHSLSSISYEFDVAVETIRDIRAKATWKHLTTDIVFPPLNQWPVGVNGKGVNQYTKDMQYIATYVNAREAEAVTGVGYKLISQVCRGNKKSAHGYIFKFVEEVSA